jgi:transcriptional regulator with GAF, ATPase, and Fis domain
MLIIYDQDRDLWDVRAGEVYFFSTRTKEQAEVVLETLDSGIEKIMEQRGVQPVSDCGAWERGLFPAVESFQRALVRDALRMTNGNKAQAAKLLKIGRTTFLGICKRLEQEAIELVG